MGELTFQLKAVGPGEPKLAFDWWKGGYDFGATLVSDGVTTSSSDGAIELTIKGLALGSHTCTLWFNQLAGAPAQAVTIKYLDKRMELTPTQRVKHDDDAMTVHLQWEQRLGDSFTVVMQPAAGQRVVLNAVELEGGDPGQQARRHWPADRDEHVPQDPILSWAAPRGAQQPIVAYDVYLSHDRQRAAAAEVGAVEHLATTASSKCQISADDPLRDYYWRVDSRYADGTLVRGKVLRFKTRTLAFPTAEGYGRFAIGGRGGRVIEVTNLNDSGPGSLRQAIETEGARTIVFRVSGTIALKSKLLIRHPYVTIAGQTAPGDGICVRGYTFGCFGTHDCIMRHMRIRVGDESGETMDGTGFASTDHSIYDHCSISWSIDEAVSSRGAKNITLQRCVVAEALNIANHRKYQAGKGHSFAGSISGDIGSFHHNLLVHCAGRNWSLAGGLDRGGNFAGRLDVRNNVVYNWQHRTNDGGVKALNLVNNLYLPGPASKVFHLLKPDAGSPTDPQQYYVSGNAMQGKFTERGDNWKDAVQVDSALIDQIRLDQPFCEPQVTTHSVEELLDNVLSDVGVNYAGLDAVDARLIDEVRQRRTTYTGSKSQLPGIIDSQADVGGWPELKSKDPVPDEDHDGIDDRWESQHGLNPRQADNNKPMPGGPTALEVYLSHLSK